MDLQNELSTKWSSRRNNYLKQLFPNTVEETQIIQLEFNLNNDISKYNKFNMNNNSSINDGFKLPKFNIQTSIRSQTAYFSKSKINFNSEDSDLKPQTTSNTIEKFKTKSLIDRAKSSYRNSMSSNFQEYKIMREDTAVSARSCSTLCTPAPILAQKSIIIDTVKKLPPIETPIKPLKRNSTKLSLKRKSSHLSQIEYEIEKIRKDTKINKRLSPEKIAELVERFKKAVKRLLTVMNVITSCKETHTKTSIEALEIYKISSGKNSLPKDLIFDKSIFKRPKEKTIPDDVKNILRMDFENRNDEQLRLAVTAINQIVPEFEKYPQQIQKSFVKYGFYEEYEPGRIILRQGHVATNYYFILCGTVMVTVESNDEVSSSDDDDETPPISFLKRGNSFGDNAILNNCKRNSTVISHGDNVVGLISIFKEDFFRVSTPVSNAKEREEFLTHNVPIFNLINYPIETLNLSSTVACNSVYFQKDSVICQNSSDDEWLYIVKSGMCKVIKTITIDEQARRDYDASKHKREMSMHKALSLSSDNAVKEFESECSENYKKIFSDETQHNKSNSNSIDESNNNNLNHLKQKFKFNKNRKAIKEETKIHLEIKTLKAGDVFGLCDIIFNESTTERNPVMLISNGVECILVNRKKFKRSLNEMSIGILKTSLTPYPDTDYLVKKYFDKEDWTNYKKVNLMDTIKSINLAD